MASRYTYEQFQKAAQDSGLWGQFSQADLLQAQKNPDFGMSILKYKNDYRNATTDAEREAANRGANELRSSWGGYTGGGNGGSFALNPMSPGSFEYASAPTYESRYDDTIQDLIQQMLERPDFSYDPSTDPLYQNYRKQYTREGQRATADTLGAAAAASGGIPSSYATTAAGQAGNYYAAQMTDMIPQLQQLAYDQYRNEYEMLLSDLGAVSGAEQMDYNKYQDRLNQYNTDRNFSYGQFLDELNAQSQRRENALSEAAMRGEIGDYGGYADLGWDVSNIPYEREWQNTLNQQNYERDQALRELAQAQVDNMLSTGTMPPAELLEQAGYSQDYANALSRYYQNEIALDRLNTQSAIANRGSGGSGSGGSGTEIYEPRLTASQVLGYIEDYGPDYATPEMRQAYDYYYGPGAFESLYGTTGRGGSQTSGIEDTQYRGIRQTIYTYLNQGKGGSAGEVLNRYADQLSEKQRQDLIALFNEHGYDIGVS